MKPFLLTSKNTDIVVVMDEGQKTAAVLLLKDRRAVSISAPVWSEQQYEDYVQRRMRTGHRTSPRLKENEK